eukprot:2845762-Rhodomonas_salina.1
MRISSVPVQHVPALWLSAIDFAGHKMVAAQDGKTVATWRAVLTRCVCVRGSDVITRSDMIDYYDISGSAHAQSLKSDRRFHDQPTSSPENSTRSP